MSENSRLVPVRAPDRGGDRSQRRPPLFSVPSTQSLRNTTFDDDSHPHLTKFATKQEFNSYAYWSYYVPILTWMPQYQPKVSLLGDFLAGLSLASFQMPLVMSFASSLAHLPPQTGLYSIVIGAVVYSILGCVPVLVVGASPSTALIFGQTIEMIHGESEFTSWSMLEIGSAISAVIGGILLSSGLLRFGFLDNVLSRALLKGFIAAMGVIMVISELSTEMGLEKSKNSTTLGKLWYAMSNYKSLHVLTTVISSVTLSIVLAVRHLKMAWVSKFRYLVYIPELLLMVIVTTAASYHWNWESRGVEIIGSVASSTPAIHLTNPFVISKLPLYRRVFSTAFLCTILGYFDSTTATKALGAQYNYSVSSNKELIALGATNIVNSLFGGLPAFGAFGRSKINLLAGASTPMAGLIMAVVTTISIVYLLPMLYFLPDCVLALTTTIIGITVLQEVPHDLQFFWRIRGWDEMLTFGIVFLTTIIWSTSAGVSLGVFIAIVRVIKHSSRSRIQVLGRVPHTSVFRNADELTEEHYESNSYQEDEEVRSGNASNSSRETLDSTPSLPDHTIAQIEDIDGVLIVKVPEPLTFANVGDLKSKLDRIERFGSLSVHPSQKSQQRDFSRVKTIVVDCKGMRRMDSSATQVLYEIVRKYTLQGVIVCFTRVPVDQHTRDKFRRSGISDLVNKNFDGLVAHPLSSGMGPGFFLSIDSALQAVVGSV